MLFQNFLQRTHLICSIGPNTHVVGRFGLFCYCIKVDPKLAEQVPLTHTFANEVASKFLATNARDPHQSTPLEPKTHVLGRFGPFCYYMKVVPKLDELVPLTL
jgi:hypothetical protein